MQLQSTLFNLRYRIFFLFSIVIYSLHAGLMEIIISTYSLVSLRYINSLIRVLRHTLATSATATSLHLHALTIVVSKTKSVYTVGKVVLYLDLYSICFLPLAYILALSTLFYFFFSVDIIFRAFFLALGIRFDIYSRKNILVLYSQRKLLNNAYMALLLYFLMSTLANIQYNMCLVKKTVRSLELLQCSTWLTTSYSLVLLLLASKLEYITLLEYLVATYSAVKYYSLDTLHVSSSLLFTSQNAAIRRSFYTYYRL